MLSKLRMLFGKYREQISYLFFGVLTTVVDWLVFFPIHNWLKVDATAATAIAWAGAVAFAYLTNKPFVFRSHDWRLRTVISEAAKFVSWRALSGLFQIGSTFIFATVLRFDGNIVKILISVVVIVLNYILSKLIVFKK